MRGKIVEGAYQPPNQKLQAARGRRNRAWSNRGSRWAKQFGQDDSPTSLGAVGNRPGKWVEKRSAKDTPEKRPGVTINRRDLIAVPVPDANLLWRDLHVRSILRRDGKQDTRNIRIDILVSGTSNDTQWECGFEFDYANQESFYCRPLRTNEDPQPVRMSVPEIAASVRVAFLPPMSGLAATEDLLQEGGINVRIGQGRTAEVLRNLCFQICSASEQASWKALVEQIRHLFGVTLKPPQFFRRPVRLRWSTRSAAANWTWPPPEGGFNRRSCYSPIYIRTLEPSCCLTNQMLTWKSYDNGKSIKS